MIEVEFPIVLSFRNRPVGQIEGITVYDNVLFHDTEDSIMFTSKDDFARHLSQKRRFVRGMEQTILSQLMMLVYEAPETDRWHAVPLSQAMDTSIYAPRIMMLRDEIYYAHRVLYRGQSTEAPPPAHHRVVMLPEPLSLGVEQRRAQQREDQMMERIAEAAGQISPMLIEFEDSEIDSDADTVLLSDDEGGERHRHRHHHHHHHHQLSSSAECSICCEPLGEERYVPSCGCREHQLCRSCLVRHSTNWQNHCISAMNPNRILCPHEGCHGHFELEELRPLLTEGDMEKIHALMDRFSTSGCVYCPNPKCHSPTISFVQVSEHEFTWSAVFPFKVKRMLEEDDWNIECDEDPVEVTPLWDGPNTCCLYLKFESKNVPHRVTVPKTKLYLSMKSLRDAEEGSLVVECTRCSHKFCYHCLSEAREPIEEGRVCDCVDLAPPVAGQINRWFVKPDRKPEEPVHFRNYELTPQFCIDQLVKFLFPGGIDSSVAVHCACCATPMHKSGACNEMTHCGLRKCYVCGLSSFEGQSNLIDHYHGHDRCPLWDSGWQGITHGMPRCVHGECHDDSRDCACPEHAAYRATVTHARRQRMLAAALKSMPSSLFHLVHRSIVGGKGGEELRALYEELVTNSFYMDSLF